MTLKSNRDATKADYFAYLAPFTLFLLFLLVASLLADLPVKMGWDPNIAPKYWVFPLQTLACGILLYRIWPKIDFRGIAHPLPVFLLGFVVFAIWVAPAYLGWQAKRLGPDGFNPDVFQSPSLWWSTVVLRFFRLVVIVPLVEEIFWRGFVMRYLIAEHFTAVPFGAWQGRAFVLTALGFMLEHQLADYPVALLTGLIYNGVACWTRSLGSCIILHAATNLFLGLYIMNTKQWGYW